MDPEDAGTSLNRQPSKDILLIKMSRIECGYRHGHGML